MEKKKTKAGKLTIDSGTLSMCSTKLNLPKSHSIIALNLQTVEDVEQVIRQCEALKGQMQGGLMVDKNTIRDSIVQNELQ